MPEIDLGPIIGPQGPQGATGPAGAVGPGVPAGGTAGQIVTKKSSTGFDTEWRSPVNNANQTEEGYVLDARMGKTLGDAIAAVPGLDHLNGSVNNPDFNNMTNPGIYYVQDIASATHAPQAYYGYLLLMVIKIGEIIVQELIGGRQATTGAKSFWRRYYYGGEWKEWIEYYPAEAVNNIITIKSLGSYGSQETFDAAVISAISNTPATRSEWIAITHNFNSQGWEWSGYRGFILKNAGADFASAVVLTNGKDIISGIYNTNTDSLVWNRYAKESSIEVKETTVSGSLKARKFGKVVCLNGYAQVSISGQTVIGDALPQEYRPYDYIRGICNVGPNAYSANKIAYVAVGSTSGQVQVTPPDSGSYSSVYMSLSWVVTE